MMDLHNITSVELSKALSARLESLDVHTPEGTNVLYDIVSHLHDGLGGIEERLENARDYAPFMEIGFGLSAVSYWALGQTGEYTVAQQPMANDGLSRGLRVAGTTFCAEIARFVFGKKNAQGAYLAVGDTAKLLSNALDLAVQESKEAVTKIEFLSCTKDASEALLGLAVEAHRCADAFARKEKEAAQ